MTNHITPDRQLETTPQDLRPYPNIPHCSSRDFCSLCNSFQRLLVHPWYLFNIVFQRKSSYQFVLNSPAFNSTEHLTCWQLREDHKHWQPPSFVHVYCFSPLSSSKTYSSSLRWQLFLPSHLVKSASWSAPAQRLSHCACMMYTMSSDISSS